MTYALNVEVDLSEYRTRVKGTLHLLAVGTARAVRISVKEGADFARANHPHKVRTGHLTSKESLRGEMRSADERGAEGELINDADYARHVEYGTKKHPILPLDYHWGGGYAGRPTSRVNGKRVNVAMGVGRGHFLRFYIGNRVVFARSVEHPGTQPMPFMEPAAEHAGQVIARETEDWTFRVCAELWDE